MVLKQMIAWIQILVTHWVTDPRQKYLISHFATRNCLAGQKY